MIHARKKIPTHRNIKTKISIGRLLKRKGQIPRWQCALSSERTALNTAATGVLSCQCKNNRDSGPEQLDEEIPETFALVGVIV